MKKFVFSLLLLLGVSAVMAQTDFRHIGYKEAIAAAKAEKKMVFIDFFTEWCGPCKRLAKDIFPLEKVGDYMNSKFVCVKIDAEKGEGPELADRFQVKAYPTMIILDENEKIIGSKVGGSSTGDEFVAALERIVDPNKTPERLKERYDAGERSADLISAYAGLLREQAMENSRPDMEKMKQAKDMVENYFRGLSDEQKLAPENIFIYMQYAEKPTDEYTRYMVAYRDDFSMTLKNDIMQRISKLYENYLYAVFCGREVYEAISYEAVKKEVQEMGLNEDGRYDLVFRFIECYALGDMNKYLIMCEKEIGNLSKEVQATLIFGMNNLMKTDDQNVLKRAVKFIRSQLAYMDVNNLYFISIPLGELENRIK